MASRPAPRRSTKQDRDYLAYLREATSNKNLTMTDAYNYDQKFKEGVTNARALGGLINFIPSVVGERVTDKSDSVSRGILNMQTQGRNMEGLFGNQVNAFGQKVDPAAQRKYRETFGRNPLYKFSVDKGSQHEFNIYENIQEPDLVTETIKGIPADFATSGDKLVRDLTGAVGIDNVDTSPFWTAGGRLASKGEFAYVSRKGDKPGVKDSVQNAVNFGSYVIPIGGIGLRTAAVGAKAVKLSRTANAFRNASKMGRYSNTLDIGAPLFGQNASSIIDNPRSFGGAAGVTGGALLSGVLGGLITRGRGGARIASTVAPDISRVAAKGLIDPDLDPRVIAYKDEEALGSKQQAETLEGINVPFMNKGGEVAVRRPKLSEEIMDSNKRNKGNKYRLVSDALKSTVVRITKQNKRGDRNVPKITGNQQRAYDHGVLILRAERANKRARDAGDVGRLEILDDSGGLSSLTKTEFDRLIANAKRNYPKIWKDKGIDGFDFSHRTSLGTPDNISNVWGNIELLPRKVNVDQKTAPWSVFRLGSPEQIRAYGGYGLGTQAIIPRP